MDNYKSKKELIERKKDVVIHSYYKFSQTPSDQEGFTNVINTDIIMNFNSDEENGKNEEMLFKQYF